MYSKFLQKQYKTMPNKLQKTKRNNIMITSFKKRNGMIHGKYSVKSSRTNANTCDYTTLTPTRHKHYKKHTILYNPPLLPHQPSHVHPTPLFVEMKFCIFTPIFSLRNHDFFRAVMTFFRHAGKSRLGYAPQFLF